MKYTVTKITHILKCMCERERVWGLKVVWGGEQRVTLLSPLKVTEMPGHLLSYGGIKRTWGCEVLQDHKATHTPIHKLQTHHSHLSYWQGCQLTSSTAFDCFVMTALVPPIPSLLLPFWWLLFNKASLWRALAHTPVCWRRLMTRKLRNCHQDTTSQRPWIVWSL